MVRVDKLPADLLFVIFIPVIIHVNHNCISGTVIAASPKHTVRHATFHFRHPLHPLPLSMSGRGGFYGWESFIRCLVRFSQLV